MALLRYVGERQLQLAAFDTFPAKHRKRHLEVFGRDLENVSQPSHLKYF